MITVIEKKIGYTCNMSYTQAEFQKATAISSKEYCELINPVFEGQTRVDSKNMYTMYFSCEGTIYSVTSKL